MTLAQKLTRLKKFNEDKKEPDWEAYKELWIASVQEIQNTIVHKWFHDYEKNGLMSFALIPTKRNEPYIGEYLTTVMEITFPDNKSIILVPVAAVTSEYDGKLEFYMRGDIGDKVNILRKLLPDNKYEWYIGKSYDVKDHVKLSKSHIERLIEEWLS
jgi:hypothetical protein